MYSWDIVKDTTNHVGKKIPLLIYWLQTIKNYVKKCSPCNQPLFYIGIVIIDFSVIYMNVFITINTPFVINHPYEFQVEKHNWFMQTHNIGKSGYSPQPFCSDNIFAFATLSPRLYFIVFLVQLQGQVVLTSLLLL